MALGAYTITWSSATSGATYSQGYTVCEAGKFNVDVNLRSILFRTSGSISWTGYPVVYTNTGTLVAKGPSTTVTTNGAASETEIAFSSPVPLTANTEYRIGFYTTVGHTFVLSESAQETFSSSPAYATFSNLNTSQYYISGDAFPTTANPYKIIGGMSFDSPNNPPNVPTGLAPNNQAADPRQTIRFSWTYSDAEGNAQTTSQIQYRLVGESLWNIDQSRTNANPYWDVAPSSNFFTLGEEYEWQVRVYDGSAWSDWSATATFMAATSMWATTEVTTSASSHNFPANTLEPGKKYVYQVRTADAVGYGPWSAQAFIGSEGGLFYKDGQAYEVVVDGVAYRTWMEDNGVWKITQ